MDRALLELYSPELNAGTFVPQAFRFLRGLLPVEQINYGNLDPRSGAMDVATDAPGPDWTKAVHGFGRCMLGHAFFSFDPAVSEGRPFFVSDFISARRFRDLDIHAECFRLLGMSQHAALHVPTPDGRRLWFGLERSGPTAYSERDRAMLGLAQRHLENARRLALSRTRTRAEIVLSPETFARADLTPREAEVAYWLTEGKTNAEIGVLMKVRTSTVKGHIFSLFNKTGTSNRLALTLHLLELGSRIGLETAGMEKVHVPAPRPG